MIKSITLINSEGSLFITRNLKEDIQKDMLQQDT